MQRLVETKRYKNRIEQGISRSVQRLVHATEQTGTRTHHWKEICNRGKDLLIERLVQRPIILKDIRLRVGFELSISYLCKVRLIQILGQPN